MADKAKKSLRWGFLLSLLIHAVVIAALATMAIHIYENRGGSSGGAGASGGGQTQAVKPVIPKIYPHAVISSLDKEDARVAELSDEAKMSELRKKSVQLSNMDAHAVDAVASVAETVKGADKSRAYEPQENVTGKFDSSTATLYDIAREKRSDQPVYIYTLVDAKGRTLKTERKMEEMSPDDMRAYELFEMGRNNSNMSRLLKSAIMIGQSSPSGTNKKSQPAASAPSK